MEQQKSKTQTKEVRKPTVNWFFKDYGEGRSIALFRGAIGADSPKQWIDQAVEKHVGDAPYNEFMEIHMDNPWTRLVVKGINAFFCSQYVNILDESNDIQAVWLDSEQIIPTTSEASGQCKPIAQLNETACFVLLRGAFGNDNPVQLMDEAASRIYINRHHNQFIETDLSLPWARVIVFGINDLNFETYCY